MWLLCALATTFIWGLAELFYKKGARPDEKYAHLKICISVGFVMGLHAVFTLTFKNIDYDPVNIIRYLPVSLFYIISMAFSFFFMRFIEESISDPIENTSGAICALMCVVLLHQTIELPSIIGILIIAVGVVGRRRIVGRLLRRNVSSAVRRLLVSLIHHPEDVLLGIIRVCRCL